MKREICSCAMHLKSPGLSVGFYLFAILYFHMWLDWISSGVELQPLDFQLGFRYYAMKFLYLFNINCIIHSAYFKIKIDKIYFTNWGGNTLESN